MDKMTGEELARLEVSALSRYGMMTYQHDGHQYLMLQNGPKLTALALPAAIDQSGGGGH